MESKIYYVYGFIRLDTNTYFYIGKGKENRCKRIDIRSNHFKSIVNKYECALEILYDNLTEKEALIKECETIEMLVFEEGYTIECDKDSEKNKNGFHLVNCTYGGEGVSGYKHTPEEIKKSTFIGKENPMYGRRGKLSPHYGKIYDDNHKEKIMLSNPKRKKVLCIEFNRVFNSYREAEKILLEEYNIICSHSSISSICLGKNKKGGYYKDNKKKCNLHFINV